MYRGNVCCSEGEKNRLFCERILRVLKKRMYADYIACKESEYQGYEEGRFLWVGVKRAKNKERN